MNIKIDNFINSNWISMILSMTSSEKGCGYFVFLRTLRKVFIIIIIFIITKKIILITHKNGDTIYKTQPGIKPEFQNSANTISLTWFLV